MGNSTLSPDASTNSVRIIALVGYYDGAVLEPIEQGFGAGNVMNLSWRDQQRDRATFRIDARVDFRREPASASAHTTISTLFFTPDAC